MEIIKRKSSLTEYNNCISEEELITVYNEVGVADEKLFTGELYGGYTNTLMTDTSQTSKAYMCVGSTAGANYQVNKDGLFETGVTAVPTAEGKELKCISQGPSLVYFKKDNPQEVIASWLFTQYLLTPEFQTKFAFASGYLPVTKTAVVSIMIEIIMNDNIIQLFFKNFNNNFFMLSPH